MNAKQRKTLEAIFSRPTPKTLPFRDVESLLKALGCVVKEREGSRIVFRYGLERWTTHRPHPDKVARAYHIKEAEIFLLRLGIKP